MLRRVRSAFPAVSLAGAEFHSVAESTWERMLADAASATERLWIENYIFEDGLAANALLRAVQQACKNGADVRILMDDFGSLQLSRGYLERLRAVGAKVQRFNRIQWWRLFWGGTGRMARRTHRRIQVVDDRLAWTGGLAFSDRWWPRDDGLEIQDAMLRVEGELVEQMAQAFDALWQGLSLPTPSLQGPSEEGKARCMVQYPMRGWRLHRELRRALAQAENQVWLSTPYFVPPRRMRRALRKAARRGVDLRLLLPGPRGHDHPVTRFAARRYYYRLLRAGVRIYEYQPAFMHAKVALFEDSHVIVGSANLDRWSWLHNHELVIAANDRSLAGKVGDWFERGFAQSEEVVMENWVRRSIPARLAERFFGLFSRWF